MQSYYLVRYSHTTGEFTIDSDTQQSKMEHAMFDENRVDDYSTEWGWFNPDADSPEEVADTEAFAKLNTLLTTSTGE